MSFGRFGLICPLSLVQMMGRKPKPDKPGDLPIPFNIEAFGGKAAMMNKRMIYYISGGERSGKSRYAMDLALALSERPVYLATARKWDSDFEKRVQRHQHERDERWDNWEEEKSIGQLTITGRVVVLDCVTLWLTNWFVDLEHDIEACLHQARQELQQLFEQEATVIIISNEIGMGVHAESHMGRKFVELQGWTNQFIAEQADKAVFMVSGLPLPLK